MATRNRLQAHAAIRSSGEPDPLFLVPSAACLLLPFLALAEAEPRMRSEGPASRLMTRREVARCPALRVDWISSSRAPDPLCCTPAVRWLLAQTQSPPFGASRHFKAAVLQLLFSREPGCPSLLNPPLQVQGNVRLLIHRRLLKTEGPPPLAICASACFEQRAEMTFGYPRHAPLLTAGDDPA
jgi:hypothetical protein